MKNVLTSKLFTHALKSNLKFPLNSEHRDNLNFTPNDVCYQSTYFKVEESKPNEKKILPGYLNDNFNQTQFFFSNIMSIL